MEVVGRETELAAVDAFLAGSGPRALELAGEAGIGKTTIWRHCVARARAAGLRVVETRPTEAEARLAFGGLADLVGELLEETADDVPAPRRAALEAALVVSGDAFPGESAVALATVSVLRAAAARRPLLLAIDDVQWLDASSALVLGYALRRVREQDAVALLTSRRTGSGAPGELDLSGSALGGRAEALRLGPLAVGAVHRLVRARLGRPLARPLLLTIHETSRGNPFYALELARAAVAEAGGLPATPGAALAGRLEGLPGQTTRALLLSALSSAPTVDTLAPLLDDVQAVLRPAVERGVVSLEGGAVRFAHPLLAAAVTDAAGQVVCRAGHAELAASSSAPDERALHLALSTTGPDEGVAATVAEAARAAGRRGARAAAAGLWQHAAELTPDRDAAARDGRLLEAAESWLAAGDPARGRTLLEPLAGPGRPQRHGASWILARLLDETEGFEAARSAYGDALGAPDPRIACLVRCSLAIALVYVTSTDEALPRAEEAVARARAMGDAALVDHAVAIEAQIRFYGGDPAAGTLLATVGDHPASGDFGTLAWNPAIVRAEQARHTLDLDAARAACERVRADAAAAGDVHSDLWAAYALCVVALQAGDVAEAERLGAEIAELSDQTGLMAAPVIRAAAMLDGHRGRVDEARAGLEGLVRSARAIGERLFELVALARLGELELSAARPAAAAGALAAARALADALGQREPGFVRFLADEAQALLALGRVDEAEHVADRLAELAAPHARPWAPQLLIRLRGLIAAERRDLDAGLALLAEAAALGSPLALEHARTLLDLGRVQRRAKRRGDARATLERARDAFAAQGAALWEAQARAELARVGGRRVGDGLTPTEQRVAALVADGLSNKEAAAALFVSVRAVEANLSRIYAKLGVRSRTELAARMAQSMGESPLSGAQTHA